MELEGRFPPVAALAALVAANGLLQLGKLGAGDNLSSVTGVEVGDDARSLRDVIVPEEVRTRAWASAAISGRHVEVPSARKSLHIFHEWIGVPLDNRSSDIRGPQSQPFCLRFR